MVVKRSCSFCAGEIEPGTGTMFIKRDGSVFHFCTSSCRKQQLHLGRVGHRIKWTRAHALKKAAESAPPKAGARPKAAPARSPSPAPAAPAPPVAAAPAAAPAPAPEPAKEPAAAKRPRATKPATPKTPG